MASLSELQEWLVELQRARASGARLVEFRERKVEYKTDAEMKYAVEDLERRIAAMTATPITRMYVNSTKGI